MRHQRSRLHQGGKTQALARVVKKLERRKNYDAGTIVEDKCRRRLLGLADDVRDQRKAIRGDYHGAQRRRPKRLVARSLPELMDQRSATVMYGRLDRPV